MVPGLSENPKGKLVQVVNVRAIVALDACSLLEEPAREYLVRYSIAEFFLLFPLVSITTITVRLVSLSLVATVGLLFILRLD